MKLESSLQKIIAKDQFCKHQISASHTLIKKVNTFITVNPVFLD
jgi:hypothetical protein